MKEVYETTIDDLRIELMNCGLFEFKRMNRIQKEIDHYEKLLNNLYT